MNIIKNKKAFSLIEVLIVIMIMMIAFVSFYSVFTIGQKYIIDSKNRLGAVAVANERMEIARNLKYGDVGILGGIPDGNIPEDEDAIINGKSYHIHTFIQYVDDEFDGVFPSDVIPNDYKVVKIKVSWNDLNGGYQSIDSISRFVPPGLETTDGGAPLAINIKRSDGEGIAQSKVRIINNNVSPNIDFTVETDNTGHILIPAAPESYGEYKFEITKNGYENVFTMDPLAVSYIPTYPNPSVILGYLNSYDYIQDKLSNLIIKAVDFQNNNIENIELAVIGGKIIGRTLGGEDIFILNETYVTDINGEKKLQNITAGQYDIETSSNSEYEFFAYESGSNQLGLVGGDEIIYYLRFGKKDVNSIALNISNSNNNPITNAKVTLIDSNGNNIFTDKDASSFGKFFYPDSVDLLAGGNYTISISADGYETKNESITVNNITNLNIELNTQ